MTPKRRFRGQPDLGRAIDERDGRRGSELEVRHDTGAAPGAPLGADAGGPGGGGEPALPEVCVKSLAVAGEDALSGALELAVVGGTEISQSATAPHFTIGSPSPLWQRESSVLRPANSGDRALLSASSPLGTVQIGAFGAGNPAVVADSNMDYAIIGRSAAELGLLLDGVADLKLLDLEEVDVAPAGYARWYNLDGGRAYLVDENDNRHDLCVQHKQCVSGQQLAAGADGETWESTAYPAGTTAASVTASRVQQFDFANGKLSEAYGRWSWQASYSDSPPSLIQSQIAVGFPFRKFGDGTERAGNCRVVVKPRLRVNDPIHFEALLLTLDDGSNRVFTNLLGQLSAGTWTECALSASGTDVGSWGADLRVTIWAQGKQHTEAGNYETTIDIERVSVEQWVN